MVGGRIQTLTGYELILQAGNIVLLQQLQSGSSLRMARKAVGATKKLFTVLGKHPPKCAGVRRFYRLTLV